MCSWTPTKPLSDVLPVSSEVLGPTLPIQPGVEGLTLITGQTVGLCGVGLRLSNVEEHRRGGLYPLSPASCLSALCSPLPGWRISYLRGDGSKRDKTSRLRFRASRTRQKKLLKGRP